jgi:hypothetical protein
MRGVFLSGLDPESSFFNQNYHAKSYGCVSGLSLIRLRMKRGQGKTVFLEMPVKGESLADFHGIHDFKAETIHEADVPLFPGKQALHGPGVPFLINPYDIEQGKDPKVEIIGGLHPDTPLQQRHGLDKDKGTGNKLRILPGEVAKVFPGTDVHQIILNHQGKEPGSIRKYVHAVNASSKYRSCSTDTSAFSDLYFPTTDPACLYSEVRSGGALSRNRSIALRMTAATDSPLESASSLSIRACSSVS